MVKNGNRGTSEMPFPKTMDYGAKFKLTPIFLSDLKIVLKNLSYIDYISYFKYIEQYDGVFPAAILDEFIHMLEKLPYSVINPLMNAMCNKDNFCKYFQKIS